MLEKFRCINAQSDSLEINCVGGMCFDMEKIYAGSTFKLAWIQRVDKNHDGARVSGTGK